MPVPEFLKQLPEYEEVWYVDLAEWELAGDPALVAAGVMADRRFPDYVRRHALLLAEQAEEEVLGADVVVVEAIGFLAGQREHLLRPVDFELKHFWERDLTVYSASPDLFWQVGSEIASSVIGDGRAAYRDFPLRQKTAVYLRKHRYHLRFWLAYNLGLMRRKVLR